MIDLGKFVLTVVYLSSRNNWWGQFELNGFSIAIKFNRIGMSFDVGNDAA